MKAQSLNRVAGFALAGAALALTSVMPAAAAAVTVPVLEIAIIDPSLAGIKANDYKVKNCDGIGAQSGTDGWKFDRLLTDADAINQVNFITKTSVVTLVVTAGGVKQSTAKDWEALLAKARTPGYDPMNLLKDLATSPAPAGVSGSLAADGIILRTPAGWTLGTALSMRFATVEVSGPADLPLPKQYPPIGLKAVCLPSAGNPGTGNPGTTDPGTGNPGTTDPGTGNPGTTNPGTGNPGTTDPGAGEPGTDEPGTDEPGTDDPASGPSPTDDAVGGGNGTDDSDDSGTAAGTTADDGGVLALTGTNVAFITTAGVLLVAAGIAFVMLTMRRRRNVPTFKA